MEVKAKIIMLNCSHDTAVRTIFVMLWFVPLFFFVYITDL